MIKSFFKVAALAAIALLPTSAMAQFNGLKVNPRVFNDYPNSTLTIARATTSRFDAFGLEFSHEGKNGLSAPFSWAA